MAQQSNLKKSEHPFIILGVYISLVMLWIDLYTAVKISTDIKVWALFGALAIVVSGSIGVAFGSLAIQVRDWWLNRKSVQ